MEFIISFLSQFLEILFTVLTWLITQLLSLIPFVLLMIAKGFLLLVSATIASISFACLGTMILTSWGAIPQGAGYLISISGIPEGLQILACAYGIRFVLNLIPAAITRV